MSISNVDGTNSRRSALLEDGYELAAGDIVSELALICRLALEKNRAQFGVHTRMRERGGRIDGPMLCAGLVDVEPSRRVGPFVAGSTDPMSASSTSHESKRPWSKNFVVVLPARTAATTHRASSIVSAFASWNWRESERARIRAAPSGRPQRAGAGGGFEIGISPVPT